MEYLPGLPQDTKSLRSCSGDRAKMLLKGQLRIICHSQYIQIVRLLQTPSDQEKELVGRHREEQRKLDVKNISETFLKNAFYLL